MKNNKTLNMLNDENKKFLFELIDAYRKNNWDVNLRTGTDLRAPLQLSLIWLKSDKNDFQLFLSNHNKNFNDKKIDFFGPYNISLKTNFRNFEDSLDKGHLFKYIGGVENEQTLRNSIIRMIRNNNKILKNEPTNEISSSGVFYKDCFYFIHNGDIFKRSIDKIMDYYQKEKIRNERFKEATKNLRFNYDMVPIFAGYVNPPIWIGEIPNLTMEEQVKGKRLIDFVKIIYKGEILERKIFLMNDGYLGISTKNRIDDFPEIKELENVKRIINFLFSVFLIKGIRLKTVQASEFICTTYLPERDFLSVAHRDHSKSKELFDKRYELIDLESFKKFRTIVSLDKVTESIDLAKNLINIENLFNSLLLLIHSYSNLLNGEINQSFILSWTILEQYLNYKWDLLLDRKEIIGNRLKKLTGRDYTASIKTEMLNLFGYLTKEDYEILNDLRKKRNKFIHEIKKISSDKAIRSLNLAVNYSKARIDDYIRESKKKNT